MRFPLMIVCLVSLCCCESKKQITYYDSGKIKSVTEIKNGVPDGTKHSYFASGALEFTASYKEGKVDGLVEHFYESGQLKSRGYWKDGRENGLTVAYYESGKPIFQAEYVSGKVKGYSKVFFESGALKEMKLYDSTGEICFIKLFDELGNLKEKFVKPTLKASRDTVNTGEEFYVEITYGLQLTGRIRITAVQLDSTGNAIIDPNVFQSEGSEPIIYRHSFSVPGKYQMLFRFRHNVEPGDTLSINGIQSMVPIVVLRKKTMES